MPFPWNRKFQKEPINIQDIPTAKIPFWLEPTYDIYGNKIVWSDFDDPPVGKFYNEFGDLVDTRNCEFPEQCLATRFIDYNSCVLELGARYGTVSYCINRRIAPGNVHVAVEPDSNCIQALISNINNNNMTTIIYNGLVSRKRYGLTSNGYGSTVVKDELSNIPIISVEELESKYNCKFNTLVADCEGFLETFFDECPYLFSQLKTVIFERDYPEKCNYEKIERLLVNNGFKCVIYGFQNVYIRDSYIER